jgi:hypothetical protein
MNAQREASHPLFYRVGSRLMRRRRILAMYGAWVLVAAMVILWSAKSPGWFWSMQLIVFAGTVFQIVWFIWLGRTYVNAPRLADKELDERLLQVKNQAYRTAYLLLAPAAAISWLLSLGALQLEPNDLGRVVATVLVFGFALVAGTLPTAIVAWREPDPEPLEN